MSSWFSLSVDNSCLVVTLKLSGYSGILFVLRTSCLSRSLQFLSFFLKCFSRCWRLLMVKCPRSSSKFSQSVSLPFLHLFVKNLCLLTKILRNFSKNLFLFCFKKTSIEKKRPLPSKSLQCLYKELVAQMVQKKYINKGAGQAELLETLKIF